MEKDLFEIDIRNNDESGTRYTRREMARYMNCPSRKIGELANVWKQTNHKIVIEYFGSELGNYCYQILMELSKKNPTIKVIFSVWPC
jgi:hypothetical protein